VLGVRSVPAIALAGRVYEGPRMIEQAAAAIGETLEGVRP
jgi:hypothetical protein